MSNKKIIVKSERELEIMRPAGMVAAKVLDEISGFIRPGVTTKQVDEFAGEHETRLPLPIGGHPARCLDEAGG